MSTVPLLTENSRLLQEGSLTNTAIVRNNIATPLTGPNPRFPTLCWQMVCSYLPKSDMRNASVSRSFHARRSERESLIAESCAIAWRPVFDILKQYAKRCPNLMVPFFESEMNRLNGKERSDDEKAVLLFNTLIFLMKRSDPKDFRDLISCIILTVSSEPVDPEVLDFLEKLLKDTVSECVEKVKELLQKDLAATIQSYNLEREQSIAKMEQDVKNFVVNGIHPIHPHVLRALSNVLSVLTAQKTESGLADRFLRTIEELDEDQKNTLAIEVRKNSPDLVSVWGKNYFDEYLGIYDAQLLGGSIVSLIDLMIQIHSPTHTLTIVQQLWKSRYEKAMNEAASNFIDACLNPLSKKVLMLMRNSHQNQQLCQKIKVLVEKAVLAVLTMLPIYQKKELTAEMIERIDQKAAMFSTDRFSRLALMLSNPIEDPANPSQYSIEMLCNFIKNVMNCLDTDRTPEMIKYIFSLMNKIGPNIINSRNMLNILQMSMGAYDVTRRVKELKALDDSDSDSSKLSERFEKMEKLRFYKKIVCSTHFPAKLQIVLLTFALLVGIFFAVVALHDRFLTHRTDLIIPAVPMPHCPQHVCQSQHYTGFSSDPSCTCPCPESFCESISSSDSSSLQFDSSLVDWESSSNYEIPYGGLCQCLKTVMPKVLVPPFWSNVFGISGFQTIVLSMLLTLIPPPILFFLYVISQRVKELTDSLTNNW